MGRGVPFFGVGRDVVTGVAGFRNDCREGALAPPWRCAEAAGFRGEMCGGADKKESPSRNWGNRL